MKFEKSAGAIIFRVEEGKIFYLLLKYPTYWGIAKGLIEKNEGEEETAKREIFEETGLKDIVLLNGFREKVKWFFKFKGELKNKEAIYFLAETKTREIKISDEHEGFKWCAFDDALKIMRVKATRTLLEKANAFVKEHLRQKKLM